MLGVAQSVGSIARIPGPLVGGFVADLAGLPVAFFISAALLMGASGIGLKAFQSYGFWGQSVEAVGS
jgi:hypothetical protein